MDKNFTEMKDGLIVRYLLGEATETEGLRVMEWARSDSSNQKQLDDFKAILEASGIRLDDVISARQALDRLNSRLGRKPRFSYGPILRYAALLAVFFSAGWFLYQNLIANRLTVGTAERTLAQHLPDGSTAILNKNSSLSFVGGFFRKHRQVSLKGEAYFKVSADKSRPFVIEVNGIRVTVVGTEFNVKSRDGETTVIVESGIVKVNRTDDSVSLRAGERVRVREGRPHFDKEENKGKIYNYYYTNELVCNQTPLIELVAVLNEKFKANVTIANPGLNALPISTTFKDETLGEILTVISETLDIKVEYGREFIKLR